MNKHVQTMKNALSNYRKTVKASVVKMEENTRILKPEEAEKANAAIMEKLAEDKATVKDLIREAQEAGQHDADAWGRLDGAAITPDARLLDAGAVNPEQFRGLVQKYQDNPTMLQLLANYAEKRNEQSGGFSAIWNYGGKGNAARTSPHFDTAGLPTAESKKAEFNSYAASAYSLADRIGNLEKGRIGYGADSPLLIEELDHFGETKI